MASLRPIFQIRINKITFKQAPTSQQGLMCNLLYNNRKIDNTEPFHIKANEKSCDLSSLKPLIFNLKEDDNKLPIYVYILYGEIKAQKIILKRNDMIKKYDLQHKDTFQFDEEFGVFGVSYQVIVKKEDVQKEQIHTKEQNLFQKILKPAAKNQQSMQRSFKRPSMLEVGAKVKKIRKDSTEHKEAAQSQVNMLGENSRQKLQNTNPKELTLPFVPPLTLVKDQKNEQNLVKKDLKINLFQNFGNLANKTAGNASNHQKQKENKHGHDNDLKAEKAQGSHHGSHNDIHKPDSVSVGYQGHHDEHDKNGTHHDSHGDHHEGYGSHHDSHGDHHDGHGEHSEPMSLKLKTVVAMLIIGFLFLMYDALDDRFSRKVKKVDVIHGHGLNSGHGHGDHHGQVSSKKKTGKKSKKVSTH